MRAFTDFVSFIAVCLAAAMALKHRLPWVFCAFLISQSVFTLFGWWLAQRVSFSSREYLFFFGTFGLVLLFALGCALHYPLHRWIGLLLIPALAGALFLAGLRIYEVLSHKAPVRGNVTLSLVDGGVLLFCGILALLSLVESLPPDLRKATLALGMFWTLQGLTGWLLAATRGKVQVGGVTLNDFLPQFIAIVCFGWLFVALSSAQAESATQHATDEQVTELQWEAAE